MKNRQICPYCNKEFSKYGIKNHIAMVHEKNRKSNFVEYNKKYTWNKGLTVETSEKLAEIGSKISEKQRNRSLSESHKKAISKSMKKAHAEGRANAWNRLEPSYPELWFRKIIENEFTDKKYIPEFPFGKYFLDFAWVHKKLCIEIDGSQHDRIESQIISDKEKDALLLANDWKVLRLRWSDVCNNTQKAIQVAKIFVESSELVETEFTFVNKKQLRQQEKRKEMKDKGLIPQGRVYVLSDEEINKRLEVIDNFDKTKWGWKTALAKKLNISHTQLARFLVKYGPVVE